MIRAVAFCPMAPVIVPALARGAAPELDELRAACRVAIRAADVPGRSWIVLGPGPTSRRFDATSWGTFAGLGLALDVAPGPTVGQPTRKVAAELPLSLTVGIWLLRDALGPDAVAQAVSVDSTGEALTVLPADDALAATGDTALLVMGEGSARRSVKAPGYLDERALPFDEHIEGALRSADPAALGSLDAALGAELLATGVPAWRAVAPALAGRDWDATVHHSADPYGVAYFVASWRARD